MDDQQRASILEDLAEEADRRREAFLEDAGRQFGRFVDASKHRLQDIGGLVLIDDDPEYLSVTREGTFLSRTRYQDESGEWVSESEEIEQAADLVELYNPADLFAAFADAARDEAGIGASEDEVGEEETAEGDEASATEEVEGLEADATEEADAEAELDDDWIANLPTPRDKPHAARLMYDLALTFQERSQIDQAQLLDDFQDVAAPVAEVLGDSKIVEDEDERLWFRASGAFEGEVMPEQEEPDTEAAEPEWQALTSADDLVQFYDPTDLFGDLAEAIAEAYPEVAPELGDDDERPAGDDGGDREQP